jgi:death-on-curing protein
VTDEEVDFLSVGDLLEIAAGVLDEVAVREPGLLAAAAGRPMMTVFGEEAYPTFEDKAAALLHSLVPNHCLVDGNKRLAWSACRVFHLLNGRDLRYTVDEAETMVVAAAAGELDTAAIATWLRDHGQSSSTT